MCCSHNAGLVDANGGRVDILMKPQKKASKSVWCRRVCHKQVKELRERMEMLGTRTVENGCSRRSKAQENKMFQTQCRADSGRLLRPA